MSAQHSPALAQALKEHARGPAALARAIAPIASFPPFHDETADSVGAALAGLGLDAAASRELVAALPYQALLMLAGHTPAPLGTLLLEGAALQNRDETLGVLLGAGRAAIAPKSWLAEAVRYGCEHHADVVGRLEQAAELATLLDAATLSRLVVNDPAGAALLGGDLVPLVDVVRRAFAAAFRQEQSSEVERSARGSDIAYGLARAPEPLPTAARRALQALKNEDAVRVNDILAAYPTLA